MTGKLAGKVAFITGAGSGIGRASAELFAAEGAAIAVVDVREDVARETADLISAKGGRAVAYAADVTDAAAIEAAVERAVSELGRLDIVYNNAGIGSTGSVADGAEADWDLCLAVNAKGTFLTSRAAVAHLQASGGGAIVNLMAANTVVSSWTDASKRCAAAMIGACRVRKKGLINSSWAMELGKVGRPSLRKCRQRVW